MKTEIQKSKFALLSAVGTACWFYYVSNNKQVKPVHTTLMLYIMFKNARFKNKDSFYLPTENTMENTGIGSHNTYSKTLKDLIDWGWVIMIEKSTNQWTANVISVNIDKIKDINTELGGISKYEEADTIAYDTADIKASVEQVSEQEESTGDIDNSINSINKNNKNNNSANIFLKFDHLSITKSDHEKLIEEFGENSVLDIYNRIRNYNGNKKYKSLYLTANNWLRNSKTTSGVKKMWG